MKLLFLAFTILLAYGIEAMTGFGSIVLALSLAALFFDIQQLLPVLVPLNILMTLPLAVYLHNHISWPLLMRTVLPWMLTGTVAGYFLHPYLSGDSGRLVFGLLILWFALRSLFKAQMPVVAGNTQRSLVFSAGVTHGLFASGGPLLVYALARSQMDKAALRATLILVWCVFNTMLTIAMLLDGRLLGHWQVTVSMIPAVLVGAWLGNRLHHRINEQLFLRLVFLILSLVAFLLVCNSLWALFSVL